MSFGSRLVRCGAGALALSGALAWADVVPFTSGEVARPASEEEARVWTAARDVDTAIARSGQVYDDDELRQYVQRVMDRLFPEFRPSLRVQLLKSPQLNAFATADGGVYVNIGLLARFRNEAQLATVLAHEGTHVTHRHGFRGREQLKSSTAWAAIAGSMLIPGLTQALASTSVYGFSRELETEADRGAYLRLVQAGYDVLEAPRIFEHLARDVQAEGAKEPYFFASHPKLQERLDNMRKLTGSAGEGGDGASREAYSTVVARARLDSLEAELSMNRVRSALLVLEDPERMQDLPPFGPYYLGEALRLRGRDGDLDRARTAYLAAIGAAPDFAPSHRALGMLQLKAGVTREAIDSFERYLALAPQAKDRKYVESYLRTARSREASQ